MNWNALCKEGMEYLNKGDYDKAIEYFEEALTSSPNGEKWMAYSGLGICYILKGDYDKAIEYFEEALTSSPNGEKWKAYSGLGTCYRLKGEYDKAIEYYEKIVDCYMYKKIPKNNEISNTIKYLADALNTDNKKDNEEKLKNCFKYIAMILSEIYNFKEELKVDSNKRIAHYTKPQVIKSMLKDRKESEKENKGAYFRLYEITYANDPEEGVVFDNLLKKNYENLIFENKNENDAIKHYYTFIGSFIAGDKNDDNGENVDKLFLWRTYGKDGNNEEAKGICICIKKEFFDQHASNLSNFQINIGYDNKGQNKYKEEYNLNLEDAKKFCLYWVIYDEDIDTESYEKDKEILNNLKNENPNLYRYVKLKKVLKNIDKYVKDLYKDENNKYLKNNEKIKNLINSLLDELRYLVKSKHYKEESECRIIKTYNIDQMKDKIKLDNTYGEFPPKLYIEIEKDFIQYIDKIILGPGLEHKEAWKNFLNYHNINVEESQCKFK